MGRPWALSILAVFLVRLGATQTFAPTFSKGANLHMARLRNDILGAADFSKNVPPEGDRCLKNSQCYSDAGTDVALQIRFFKVQAVEAAKGSMTLKVWWRMQWRDTRLAWNESAYGGIKMVYYSSASFTGAEDNEIWIPDIQPYNSKVGIVHTLDPAQARVSSNGDVFYSRPGTLEVMCKFSGLVAFPFDKLKCPIEVGGWGLSGGQQGIELLSGGYEFSNQEATSGSSYQEYEIESANATITTYTYACCPSEPWPIILYDIQLRRASDFYVVITIVPGILLTILSFVVFWTPTGAADPLGYGVSVVVVNVLSNIVLIDMLPVCGEMIWIDLFCFINTAFCCISLFQSALCIMLESNEDAYFVPSWLSYTAIMFLKLTGLYRLLGMGQKGLSSDSDSDKTILTSAVAISESIAGVLYRQSANGSSPYVVLQAPVKPPPQTVATEVEKVERLIFFEHLFFLLDTDSSMYIDRTECDALLSFAALSLDPNMRTSIMNTHDKSRDGKLSRAEFVELCVSTLWDVPFSILTRAVDNVQNAKQAKTKRNRVYWNSIADRVDTFARYGVPALYFLALIIVFHIDLRDEYDKGGTAGMFSGINAASSFQLRGVILLIVYCLAVIFSFVMWLLARTAAKNATERVKKDYVAAGRSAAQSISASSNALVSVWEQTAAAVSYRASQAAATSTDDVHTYEVPASKVHVSAPRS